MSTYFECHVTIEPVFEERLELLKSLSSKQKFQVAHLLMQKREKDSPERSKYDSFLTGHAIEVLGLIERMSLLIASLKEANYKIYRYKIEGVVLDSRINDTFGLLDREDTKTIEVLFEAPNEAT